MYTLKLHKNLTKERWQTFGETKQLLMIANELNRAKNWIKKKDIEETMSAYERAFELLDLTISITTDANRLKELLRFREFLGFYYQCKEKKIDFADKLLRTLLSLDKQAYQVLQS